MKVAIAGTGYVGLVTGVCIAHMGYHDVVCTDINKDRIEKLNNKISPIYEKDLDEFLEREVDRGSITFTTDEKKAYEDSDVIFIAVGTPERTDGSANLEYIKKVAKSIAKYSKSGCLVVIKSTVPVGTNDEIEKYINSKSEKIFEVASNPEFLAQGTAIDDTINARRIVLGVESEDAKNKLEEIYKGFNSPIIVTNRRSAEMIKYASNDFLALKISYMSDIANLCEIVGADIEEVALGMSYDDRIGAKFLRAGIGYGGSCFPKDTKALHWLSNSNGYELKTIKAAIEINEAQKLKLVREADKDIDSFEGMKVCVLGLTYKPGTDDLREAPSIVNIKYLIERNAEIHVYDPVGMNNMKKIFSDKIIYDDDIEDALRGSEACFVMTEWKEIRDLTPEIFLENMRVPRVYDGRNCYDVDEMLDKGIKYYSIGRTR